MVGNYSPWFRTFLESFREVGDGVWLPERLERQSFPHGSEDPATFGELSATSTCTVIEFALNEEVTDKDFAFRVRKGDELSHYTDFPGEEGSRRVHTVLTATDHDVEIAMPLDQPANDSIKRVIVENDPDFYS